MERQNEISFPKISVITVVRNGREFVEQTINSVLSQSYQNIEYIVIDGGSTDGTVDIIKSHDSQITKWISEKDRGIADAFNKGLALAGGDYLLFLNADDALAHPGVLQEVVEAIVANGYPELIYGDCDLHERTSGAVLHRTIVEFSPVGLKKGKIIPHPALFTKRSYFEKYGGFDTDYKIAMDYEWLLRGALHERVVHMHALVTNVRSGGISAVQTRQAADEIIAALKKNKCISGWAGVMRLKSYFRIRAMARTALGKTGLYDAFTRLRSKAVKGHAAAGNSNGPR